MKKILIYFVSSVLFALCVPNLNAQCTLGDLSVQNLSFSPSDLRSCNQASVMAEWINIGQFPIDGDFHSMVLIISLPSAFDANSGTLSITASNGEMYWNSEDVIITTNEVQVPLTGQIPDATVISISINKMDINMTESLFESFNISQSISQQVPDCNVNNDEQSISGNILESDGPQIVSLESLCDLNQINLNLTAESDDTPFSGAITSYSWEGPNNFTSNDQNPSFNVPQDEVELYRGEYAVTVTDANNCITVETISLDEINCLALPIELLRFSATPVDQGVELEWETATEINNSHFEIQRSADGRHYQTIGQVAGHGTTSEVNSYSFLDNQPMNGKNHYRLKQVDFDGSFEYSPVKQVELSGQSHLIIYPNPAEIGSEVTIRGQEIRDVRVYDMLGKLFLHEEYHQPTHEVKLSSSKLPRGMYITRINNSSEKRLVIN